jgi:diacylglycerol kinase family enzyme
MVKNLDFSLLVILNTPYYANGLKLGRDNGSFDGILDCCAIDTRTFWDTFLMALKIQRGTHTQCQNVEYVHSPGFKAFSEYPLDILADGEIIEEVKEFEVSIIRDKIKVLCI